ncbi:exonuclease SbcCD subunit D [[Clostridium] polysaccharolyticum]|uniref:Nuclease SbcCD subunit D n=1 Tax=[Clostridium] polysaccharolyticum TaxID=29364 RepID=A0A1H9ZPN2_9FIRM|nr:exonuclease SbcCD subunit D [[Clostridium] polysaccharolyticum]SES83650.1 Exodeoxyribonuclease I subunit D [[Clostridium] polysaccharolyticum]
MKILHSSDWHLGKNLEGQSRLPEQEQFLNDFTRIAEENEIDVVFITGDIYDSGNPPAKAEQLFYDTLKNISKDGERLIVVIAGNHDSPERLTAARPLAMEHGIIMAGTPKTVVPEGTYGQHRVIASGEGYVEVEVHGERAVILLVPFPSEKRLNEFLYDTMAEEEEKQQSYKERIKELFGQLEVKFREDTINLVMAHIFASGVEETGSERSLALGGSYLVDGSCFPKTAQYIALGHIHRMQTVPGTGKRARYSGSPIHFNRKEVPYEKKVLKVDVSVGKSVEITEIPLQVYKPIEVWKCSSFLAAREKCQKNTDRDCWVYLEIRTDSYITEEQIKELKSWKKDILEITPVLPGQDGQEYDGQEEREKSFQELFLDFYKRERGAEPEEELVKMLFSIIEQEEEDEAVTAENQRTE